jgi:hypothetical protein
MRRGLRSMCVMLSLATVPACGDYDVQDLPVGPGGGSLPGSTTSLGSVTALLDGEPFSVTLGTGAIHANGRLGFGATSSSTVEYNFGLSVRLPGPGTFETGSQNSPFVSLAEVAFGNMRRWVAPARIGAGSMTVSFLSSESASGYFSFELVPDSATAAAGITESRYLTNGMFNVSISR